MTKKIFSLLALKKNLFPARACTPLRSLQQHRQYSLRHPHHTHGRGETKHRGGIGVLLLHRLADLRRRRLLPLRYGRMAGPHDISRGRRKQGHNAGAGRAGGCLSQKGVQGRHHAPAEPHLPSL